MTTLLSHQAYDGIKGEKRLLRGQQTSQEINSLKIGKDILRTQKLGGLTYPDNSTAISQRIGSNLHAGGK